MLITYKKATIQDLERIMSLIESAIIRMEDRNVHQWDNIYPTREDFKRDIEAGDLVLGFVDKLIAVVYAVNGNFDEAYKNGQWKYAGSKFRVIHRLCVNPAFQNQGVASAAMEHIEREQIAQGTESIRLDVFSENPYAIRLYEHCGYEQVGTADWRKGRFYLMEKLLYMEMEA